MAIVTFEKTYEFDVNHEIGAGMGEAEFYGYVPWRIKDRLINWTNNPWTVALSSNASDVGADDYWDDWTDLHWNPAGVAHSWIVLSCSQGGQLLIDLKATSTREDIIKVAWSCEGAYTEGTTLNAPTAYDEVALIDNDQWIDSYGPYLIQMHLIHSTDGQIDHILLTQSGSSFFYWCHNTVQCPVANYSLNNVFFSTASKIGSRCSYSYHTDIQQWVGKASVTGDTAGMFRFGLTSLVMGVTGNNLGQIITGANSLSGKYVLYPIGIMSMTVGVEGRHGRLADQWFCPSTLATGTTLEEVPGSPTYELAVFANMVLPWNGTSPVVS